MLAGKKELKNIILASYDRFISETVDMYLSSRYLIVFVSLILVVDQGRLK